MSDECYLFTKEDGTWWARKRRQGKEYYRRLDTKDKALARQRAKVWVRSLIAESWGEKPRRTFREAAERFAEDHFRTMRQRGAERYVSSMVHLIGHFGDMYLDEITSAVLSDFEKMRSKAVRSPTIRRDLACLSSIFTCAEEWEWSERNPVKPFLRSRRKRGLDENEPRDRFLTLDEEAAIHAKATDLWRFRMAFAADTGFRKNEQFSTEWRNVNLNAPLSLYGIGARGEVRAPGKMTKSGKTRSVPLMDRTYDMLKYAQRKSMLVFPTEYNQPFSKGASSILDTFKQIAEKAGVEGVIWHDLRRTCGCRLLQDYRLNMAEVTLWLGHSSVKVTEDSYAFLGINQLHRAYDKGRENVVDFRDRGTRKGISEK